MTTLTWVVALLCVVTLVVVVLQVYLLSTMRRIRTKEDSTQDFQATVMNTPRPQQQMEEIKPRHSLPEDPEVSAPDVLPESSPDSSMPAQADTGSPAPLDSPEDEDCPQHNQPDQESADNSWFCPCGSTQGSNHRSSGSPNQDCCMTVKQGTWLIAALGDGLSQPQGGELASQFAVPHAVEACAQWLKEQKDDGARIEFQAAWQAWLFDYIDKLSQQMYDSCPPPPTRTFDRFPGQSYPGPSTTLILALCQVMDGKIITRWASIGDSSIGRANTDRSITMFTSRDREGMISQAHPDALPFNTLPIETGIDIAPATSSIFLASDGAAHSILSPDKRSDYAESLLHADSKRLQKLTDQITSDDSTIQVVRLNSPSQEH